MKFPILVSMSLSAALAITTTGYTQETFRCGSSLISPGMSADEVVQKCGQPDGKEVIEEPIRARNAGGGSRVIGTAIVEHWTYSRGSGQFPALLQIEEGELKRIDFLEQN